jgi:hypothetical protein
MISIHQSQFLSWTPFYYKAIMSDNFIILDDVQFQKNGVQNRNLIKTPQGETWLTLPAKYDLTTPINKVLVSDKGAYKKILKTIELNYKKSIHFNLIFEMLLNVMKKEYDYLVDTNDEIFKNILSLLNCNSIINKSSNLNCNQTKDDLVIEIIKKVGDFDYLSGSGALSYMNLDKFKNANIKVYVSDFKQEPYKQLWEKQQGFIKNLSIIDLLFNNFDHTLDYIQKSGNISRII